MQQLVCLIEEYVKLNAEAINTLERAIEFEAYKNNQIILDLDQRCNKIWFIKSGMVRKYHLHKGKEITLWIHVENEMFTSLSSYFHQSPATEILQACEKSELISISRQNSEKLSQIEEFVTFYNKLIEEQFVTIDKVTREFNLMNAKEKYDYLRKIAPEITKRAKLGHIASIMRVTQETLSRIRKQS